MTSTPKVECMDCAALEVAPVVPHPNDRTTYRPRHPRPIDPRSTPRRPRCTTHWRAWNRARRQVESDKRSRARSGLDEGTRRELLAEQGNVCAGCGAQPRGKRLNLDADHDHERAREHDHADDVACLECMAGYLCRMCNREIIGRLARSGRGSGATRTRAEVAAVLARMSRYLLDPPAARVRARRLDAAS